MNRNPNAERGKWPLGPPRDSIERELRAMRELEDPFQWFTLWLRHLCRGDVFGWGLARQAHKRMVQDIDRRRPSGVCTDWK